MNPATVIPEAQDYFVKPRQTPRSSKSFMTVNPFQTPDGSATSSTRSGSPVDSTSKYAAQAWLSNGSAVQPNEPEAASQTEPLLSGNVQQESSGTGQRYSYEHQGRPSYEPTARPVQLDGTASTRKLKRARPMYPPVTTWRTPRELDYSTANVYVPTSRQPDEATSFNDQTDSLNLIRSSTQGSFEARRQSDILREVNSGFQILRPGTLDSSRRPYPDESSQWRGRPSHASEHDPYLVARGRSRSRSKQGRKLQKRRPSVGSRPSSFTEHL